MRLEKLEILGFKSFAKKTNLVFPPGITCIVGPNGCGKSNIADCVHWVLGEQGLKNLRAGKNEDLVFSAGKKRMSLSQASIFFKNNNQEEIKITRRYFRNGENEYLINNKKSKREDLIFYLSQINFGQKSYSLIGQGMVDKILYSSKQERKEFFDEATGVRDYQIKKTRAVAKIKKGLKNLNQAEIAIKEVGPRMKFLSRQIKKWEKRQEIENKLIDLVKKYYGAKIFRFEKERKIIDKKFEEEKKIFDQRENELKSLQREFGGIAEYRPDEEFKKLQSAWHHLLDKRKKILIKKSNEESQLVEKKITEVEKEDINQIEKPIKQVAFQQKALIEKLNQVEKKEELEEVKRKAQEILESLDKIITLFFSQPTSKENIIIKKEEPEEEGQLKILNQEINELEEKLSKFLEIENQKRKEMLSIQTKLQEKQNSVSSLGYKIKEIEMARIRLETRQEDLKTEIEREEALQGLTNLPEIEIPENEEETIFFEIQRFKKEMDAIGNFDEGFLQEYKEVKEKYDFLYSQINDLEKSIKGLEEVKKKLDQQIKSEFFSGFHKINKAFEEYFKFLFKGGSAGLILEEREKKIGDGKNKEDDPRDVSLLENEEEIDEEEFEVRYGVEIYARPPQKKNKVVQSLSGGEKALTSIALLCAILKIKKPPFVLLDEVDAALDEINTIRLTEILKELSKNIQILIITHNPVTMEVASALYGVTIDKESSSHLVSMKLDGDD